MVMDGDMSPIPLLQRVSEGLSIDDLGMNILKFNSSEVLNINLNVLCCAVCVILCTISGLSLTVASN